MDKFVKFHVAFVIIQCLGAVLMINVGSAFGAAMAGFFAGFSFCVVLRDLVQWAFASNQ